MQDEDEPLLDDPFAVFHDWAEDVDTRAYAELIEPLEG
jgi:hypothetical protein